MPFSDYQRMSRETAIYPGKGELPGLTYCVLGLSGETGEIAEKIKKIIRDKHGILMPEDRLELQKELGDALWYLTQIATELGLGLETVAEVNIKKLSDRKQRNVLHGAGDNR